MRKNGVNLFYMNYNCIVLIFCVIGVSSTSKFEQFIDENDQTSYLLREQLDRAKVEIRKSLMELNVKHKREIFPSIDINLDPHREIVENLPSNYSARDYMWVEDDYVRSLNIQDPKSMEGPLPVISNNADDVIFAKMYKWNDVRMIIAGDKKTGECLLFLDSETKNKGLFKLQQTIKRPTFSGSYPVDGEFFVHNKVLYLYLIYDTPNHKQVPSTLYSWQKTYFDIELEDLYTQGAVDICCFNYGSSVIILIIQYLGSRLQETDSSKLINSLVVKFSRRGKEKSQLEKIQFLPTKIPQKAFNFQFYDYDFVLICEKELPVIIYSWEGGEFIQWAVVASIKNCETIRSGKFGDNTLLISHDQSRMYIYQMTWRNLKMIKQVPYSGDILDLDIIGSNVIATVKNDTFTKVIISNLIIQNAQIVVNSNATINNFNSTIQECFNNFARELGFTGNKLSNLEEETSNLLNYIAMPNDDLLAGNNESEKKLEERYMSNDEMKSIYSVWILLKESLEKCESIFHGISQRNLNNDGEFEFKKDIYVEHLKLNCSILSILNLVNDYAIDPSKLISLSKTQFLYNVEADMIKVNWLLADYLKNITVGDLILNDGKIWHENVHVLELICLNMVFKSDPLINGIHLNGIVNKNNSHLKYYKNFPKVTSTTVNVDILNKKPFQEWYDLFLIETRERKPSKNLLESIVLTDDTIINNLYVEFINKIHFYTLLNNLALNDGRTTIIDGNLSFESGFQAVKLTTHYFNSMFADVYKRSRHYYGPAYVNKEIHNSDGNPSFRTSEKRKIHEPIKYKKKLIVKGCLKVNKLVFESSNLMIKAKNYSFANSSIRRTYWTRTLNQIIPQKIIFNKEFEVEGDIKLADMSAQINRINISDLITSDQTQDISSEINFQNVKINGNVTTSAYSYSTGDAETFSDNSFFDNEEIHSRKSDKLFDGSVNKRGYLMTDKRLIIQGNVYVQTALVRKINDYNFQEEFDSISKRLIFNNVKAKELHFKSFNGININETIDGRKPENITIKKIVHKLLATQDNVNLLFVKTKTINGIDINEMFPRVYNFSKGGKVKGLKRFGIVYTDDVISTYIGDMNSSEISYLANHYLHAYKPQVFKNHLLIKNRATIGYVDSPVLSGWNVNSFINVENDLIIINSPATKFENLMVKGKVETANSKYPCLLPKFVDERHDEIDMLNLTMMEITEYIKWNNGGELEKMLKNSVLKSSEQLITGSLVTFDDVISINSNIKLPINGVDMSFIFKDAVFKDEGLQIIKGIKEIKGEVNIHNLNVTRNATITEINQLDISLVKERVFLKNSSATVYTPVRFIHGFTAENIITKAKCVNNVKTEDMLNNDTELFFRNVVFKRLYVSDNVTCDTVNGVKLTSFLGELIYLNSEDIHFTYPLKVIGNVTLEGANGTINTINNVNLNDLLWNNENMNHGINFKGCKTFENPVYLKRAQVNLDFINELSIEQIYKKSITRDKNYTFDNNIIFERLDIKGYMNGSKYTLENGTELDFLYRSNSSINDFINYLFNDN